MLYWITVWAVIVLDQGDRAGMHESPGTEPAK